jgi:hypothetical protein
MVKIKPLFVALLLVLFTGQAMAQSRQTLEDQGYDALNAHQYVKAYEIFDKLHSRYPKEIDYQFKLGICCLNYADKKDRAIEIFKDMKAKYKTLEVEIYLGKAYHRNYKFDEGIMTLQPLVDVLTKSTRKEDKAFLEEVNMTINNCVNGKFLMQNKIFADIQNIGPPVNTNELEGVPIITADESMMIYTYVGHKSTGGKLNAALQSDPVNGLFRADIFMSIKDTSGTKWGKPQPMKALNTLGEDAAIAISASGQSLFTFLSTGTNPGDILVSKLVGNEFTAPVALNGNINTVDYWEGSCSISADGKYLYFASERPEGLGGRDIWVSENIDGDWGPAVNLGPNINTPYDDDAPFIHPDGVTLFFSSKGHQSIGGYDIMFSIKEGNEWTKPKSMGIPLNTTEDDSYYVINSKGDKGYFSSDRTGSGGFGEQDIYMVTPGILGEKPVVALIKGTVYGDDRPIEAKVEVIKTAKKESIGPFFSNIKTGKYLMALSPGFIYRIKVSAEGYESIEEDLDIESLSGYMEQAKDFYMYTSGYAATFTPPKKSEVKTTIKVQPPPKETKPEPVAAVETKKEEPKIEEPKEEPGQKGTKTQDEPKKEETKKEETKAEVAKEEPKTEVAKEEPKEPVLAAKEKKKEKAKTKEKEEVVSNAPCNGTLPDLSPLKSKTLNEGANYRQLLAIMGDYCANNLVYKVQVGAYKKPENYNPVSLKSIGKIESENYPDGITRFTQKQFNTLNAAEAHRQKAIAKGQNDAWIVAFVDGRRFTLEDLIMVDFQGKPIN